MLVAYALDRLFVEEMKLRNVFHQSYIFNRASALVKSIYIQLFTAIFPKYYRYRSISGSLKERKGYRRESIVVYYEHQSSLPDYMIIKIHGLIILGPPADSRTLFETIVLNTDTKTGEILARFRNDLVALAVDQPVKQADFVEACEIFQDVDGRLKAELSEKWRLLWTKWRS